VVESLGFSFTKADRILKRAEFLELSKTGRQVRCDLFIATVAAGKTDRSRLGITVTRKVAGAVQRNRIKRLVRECYRLHGQRVKGIWDINVIARIEAVGFSHPAVFRALRELFEKVSKLGN
jgi:ribonuclease P protein component